MRIFVTGASGFIGGAATRALAATHELRAMSRSEDSDARIRALGATPVRSALGSVDAAQLAGCDAVVHCAAFVSQWGAREDFQRVNVDGTAQLLDAARAAGVQRFIHIGTEAALFRGQHLRDIDESYPYPVRTPFLYAETKAAAERLVLAADSPGFETLSLRPRMVWGPGDQTILPAVEAMVRSGRFMWIDRGAARTSTTHIDNIVHAIGLALTGGRGGRAYFITDDGTTTMRDFLTALLATRGLTPPDKSLPGAVARAMAAAVEGTWALLRLSSEPPLTRLAANLMSRDCTLRCERARAELGYRPVISREEGLRALSATAANR